MKTIDRRQFMGMSIATAFTAPDGYVNEGNALTPKSAEPPRESHLLFENRLLSVEASAESHSLWQLRLKATNTIYGLTAPALSIDGHTVAAQVQSLNASGEIQHLNNGTIAYRFEGACVNAPYLKVMIRFQCHPDSSFVRFSYRFTSTKPVRMSKPLGHDSLSYGSIGFGDLPFAREVRLTTFIDLTHSYQLSELEIPSTMWDDGLSVIGPILTGANSRESVLIAYEHGSESSEIFLQFKLHPTRCAELLAVKGNYLSGQSLSVDQPYTTVWFQVGAIAGNINALASTYRRFILKYQTDQLQTRAPYIFYNTFQEQVIDNWATGKGYLHSMNEEQIIKQIDVASSLGIEVFVIDVGWFERSGDWNVNTARFSPHLRTVRSELERRGMRLGLWFGTIRAAVDSTIAREHPEWRFSRGGVISKPLPVWETEDSYTMCLVSGYADALADQLIGVAKDTGVTYFKWDGLRQVGCDSPLHLHGDTNNNPREREASCAFQYIDALSKIAQKITDHAPDAVIQIDSTERGRPMGLAWLAHGSYSFMNSGPYLSNYDMPFKGGNPDVFHYPGQARTWILRTPLSYDRWLPSTSFLTHYLPDDPRASQEVNLASLILGQNGIWGDLLAVSAPGINYISSKLRLYKTVRRDITDSDPIVRGIVSGSPEIHEKISVETGRGVVVFFATAPGTYSYATTNRVIPSWQADRDMRVSMDRKGCAMIEATFQEPGARIVFFTDEQA